MKKRVLITGGAGYIGSHTAVELISAGYELVLVDNFSNSDISAVEGIRNITGVDSPFVEADTCDLVQLRDIFDRYTFDTVIHFAAYKAVGESVSDPLKYYRNNLESFMNVLLLMKEYGRQNILFSSSATVYGNATALPVTESSPVLPAESPYGNTKKISEEILKDTVSAYPDIRGVALRYFNPIGAHSSALLGELPRGVPNNLVPYITQTAAGVRPQLSIFGNDYDTPDGTCRRDFIDITDLARAHVAAVDRMTGMAGERYEVFNVGTGEPVSVLELVRKFEEVNGVKLNYSFVSRRAGDVPSLWADVSSANRILGWEAEVPLDETLRNAWRWEKRIREI